MKTETTIVSTAPRAEHTRSAWATRGILGLSLGLALLGLGLGLTIPLTMPVAPLMLLRIGTAELCLWLLGLDVIALLVSLVALRRVRPRTGWWVWAAVACSIVGGVLAAIPAAQIPSAAASAEAAMQSALGKDYASRIPTDVASQMRSTTFSIGDYIKGIEVGSARLTKDIPYRTVDGQSLLLDRYDPPGAGPHPGLLVIHGGSWRNGDKGEYPEANYYFAARGYVVYDIQYRLSAQGFHFPGQLEDVECALGYMRSHAASDNLDPERVVTFGRSAGAHLALLAAYRAQRDPSPAGCARAATVKAAVAYYAPTDLRDDYLHPAEPDLIDAHMVLGNFLGSAPDEVPGQYESATPQHWLDRPVPPTLLIQGNSDQIVLSRNAEELAAPLRAAHDTVVAIRIPWAGHGFDAIFQGPGSQLALYYWERFMAYTLANP
jgi:acetyl esterase/lipase